VSTAAKRLAKRIESASTIEECHAIANELLTRIRQKGPRKSLALPGRSREEKRAEHRASTETLRTMVLERSGGACEACRMTLGIVWELHHVQGAGLRRSRQRLGSVLALCMECHRRAHRGDIGTLAQIALLAPSLDAEARREAEHRIEKLIEARRSKETP
jgi:hypothetical protein